LSRLPHARPFRVSANAGRSPNSSSTGPVAASPVSKRNSIRAASKEPANLRVYRNAYPCGRAPAALKTIEADHPPYLPKQLIVLGRGYLPSTRHIELPMGRAPAQAYFYAGADTLDAIEQAARRAIAADFPGYASGGHFAFNWAEQRGATGNQPLRAARLPGRALILTA
jgi:hypothetical protein